MFKQMKTWNWTPRAYEIWWAIKFIANGLLIIGLLVVADWMMR